MRLCVRARCSRARNSYTRAHSYMCVHNGNLDTWWSFLAAPRREDRASGGIASRVKAATTGAPRATVETKGEKEGGRGEGGGGGGGGGGRGRGRGEGGGKREQKDAGVSRTWTSKSESGSELCISTRRLYGNAFSQGYRFVFIRTDYSRSVPAKSAVLRARARVRHFAVGTPIIAGAIVVVIDAFEKLN